MLNSFFSSKIKSESMDQKDFFFKPSQIIVIGLGFFLLCIIVKVYHKEI